MVPQLLEASIYSLPGFILLYLVKAHSSASWTGGTVYGPTTSPGAPESDDSLLTSLQTTKGMPVF